MLVYLADEAAAVRFAAAVRAAAPPWLQDAVPAYASVGVFFDADRIGLAAVMEWLREIGVRGQGSGVSKTESRGQGTVQGSERAGAGPSLTPDSCLLTPIHTIPVCYEFAPDLPRVCEHTHLSADDVIRLHTATEYTVYAVGFTPGFPYLGYLPPELCGVGRLPSPRLRVEPGSVGLTGRQTAVYPFASPGGWNLIGRTPLVIVDVAAGFFPVRVGDRVRFERIDSDEFRRLEGERLSSAERGARSAE